MAETENEEVAVITGAGGGLGRALSVALARRGIRVAGLGRRAQALDETAALIAPGRFIAVPADVSDPEAVRAAFARIAQHGPVAVLVNNAATYPRRDVLEESAESFGAVIATNLVGMFACSRAALDVMVARGRGRIVNVSSFADVAPLPASAAYSVSKGAGRILSRALVADLGDRFPGIVITTWMPGMLATDMGLPEGLAPEVAAEWGATLAQMEDPAINGAVFEMDREVPPPRGLKRRLADRLLRRKVRLVRLDQGLSAR